MVSAERSKVVQGSTLLGAVGFKEIRVERESFATGGGSFETLHTEAMFPKRIGTM